SEQIRKDIILQVRTSIGSFATPKAVFIINDLPKTRSGKIMRRILRKNLEGQGNCLGDTSTLINPSVIGDIIYYVGEFGVVI
ncbi:acetyl-coenzyme A synthetase, partial [Calycina marina]